MRRMRILKVWTTAVLLLIAVAVSAACDNPESILSPESATPTATAAASAPTASPTAIAVASPTPESATPTATAAPSAPTASPTPDTRATEEAKLERVTEEVIARHHRAVVEHAPEWMIAAHLESEEEIHTCLEEHAKRRLAEGIGDDDAKLHECILTTIEGAHTHEFFDLPKEERLARLETLIDSTCHYASQSESEACRTKMDGLAMALVEAEDPIELHKIFTERYFGKR